MRIRARWLLSWLPPAWLVALWQRRHPRRPQLVHARSYVPAAIAFLLHRLTGVPFIFDMRALWPEELITAGHLHRGSLLHQVLLLLEKHCLRDATAVVSLTLCALVNSRNTLANFPTSSWLYSYLCRSNTLSIGRTGSRLPSSNWLYRHCAQRLVFDRLASGFLGCS